MAAYSVLERIGNSYVSSPQRKKTVAFCSIAPASRTSSNLLRRPFFWPSKPEAR